MKSTKILIIIPAYNEGAVIRSTLSELRKYLDKESIRADILVVDDGSSDETYKTSREGADITLRHELNRGLGAAITTGIAYARRAQYQYALTFDADGQHNPSDIKKCLSALNKCDLVIGSRFKGESINMPFSRKLLLKISNFLTLILFGIPTSDSQSGFRGLGRKAIEQLQLKSSRMEVSSEFFGEAKRLNLKLLEIPIKVRYTDYSLAKGLKNSSSPDILLKLLYLLGR